MEENKQLNVLSEADSEKLLKRLLLPEGSKFSPQEVATLLELESLPSPKTKEKKKESKSKTGVRNRKLGVTSCSTTFCLRKLERKYDRFYLVALSKRS